MDVESAAPLHPSLWVIEATSALVTLAEVPLVEKRLKLLQGYLSKWVSGRRRGEGW